MNVPAGAWTAVTIEMSGIGRSSQGPGASGGGPDNAEAEEKAVNRDHRAGSSWEGAGDGNRTRVASLEDWGSTIELRPRSRLRRRAERASRRHPRSVPVRSTTPRTRRARPINVTPSGPGRATLNSFTG